MPAGRPSDYRPEMIDQSRRYIEGHLDFDDPVPTVAGLACVLGTTRKTIYEWAKEDKPGIRDILEELAQKQERQLVKNGLLGEFNAPISKMMLTKHGYSDAVDNRHSSPDGSMSPPTEIIIRSADGKGNG